MTDATRDFKLAKRADLLEMGPHAFCDASRIDVGGAYAMVTWPDGAVAIANVPNWDAQRALANANGCGVPFYRGH